MLKQKEMKNKRLHITDKVFFRIFAANLFNFNNIKSSCKYEEIPYFITCICVCSNNKSPDFFPENKRRLYGLVKQSMLQHLFGKSKD